jgi:hypothetical protein
MAGKIHADGVAQVVGPMGIRCTHEPRIIIKKMALTKFGIDIPTVATNRLI